MGALECPCRGYSIHSDICLHADKSFLNLVKQTQIILYLPLSDWFGTQRNSVWFQINRKMVNTIWLDVTRFRRKKISLFTLEKILSENDSSSLYFPRKITYFLMYFDEDSKEGQQVIIFETHLERFQSARIAKTNWL